MDGITRLESIPLTAGEVVRADIDAIFDRTATLASRPRTVRELPGGLTNRNYQVTTTQGSYVARIAGTGSDLLTISPHLITELATTEGDLPRKLDPEKAKTMEIEKITVDKATFDKMHAADRMAHDKLKEGIEGFSKALENLELLLAKRLTELEARDPKLVSAD